MRSLVEEYETSLPENCWPNWVLGNHDNHRIATALGQHQTRIAMMLLLTLRGTPTIYYGEELGSFMEMTAGIDCCIPAFKARAFCLFFFVLFFFVVYLLFYSEDGKSVERLLLGMEDVKIPTDMVQDPPAVNQPEVAYTITLVYG